MLCLKMLPFQAVGQKIIVCYNVLRPLHKSMMQEAVPKSSLLIISFLVNSIAETQCIQDIAWLNCLNVST